MGPRIAIFPAVFRGTSSVDTVRPATASDLPRTMKTTQLSSFKQKGPAVLYRSSAWSSRNEGHIQASLHLCSPVCRC